MATGTLATASVTVQSASRQAASDRYLLRLESITRGAVVTEQDSRVQPKMLDRALGKSMADLKDALPKTWSSPTMSPHCADETKYAVADAVVRFARRA